MYSINELKVLFPAIGECIGKGVDGQVFALGDNEAIKFSSHYDQQLLAEIAAGHYTHYVAIIDFGVLIDRTHFTIMERLSPLSDDETKLFHSILSHEDRGLSKVLSPADLHRTLDGLEKGLAFDRKQVVKFYAAVILSSMTHLDLHPRNILKTKDGAFKLIDLNRIRKE
jgi:hypothetical protein